MPPRTTALKTRSLGGTCRFWCTGLYIIATVLSSVRGALGQTTRSATSPFVVVFIDNKTEKVLGAFPYDRSILAQGVEKATALRAKGVVLKFFLDKPRTAAGDRALEQAARGTRLLLEARLDDQELKPNPFSDRFQIAGTGGSLGHPLSGTRGWIPLPELSAVAYDVGFVDYRQLSRMPLIERYNGSLVRSLYLCCVELAEGKRAEVKPGRFIRVGAKTLSIDDRSEAAVTYPARDDLPYIPFCDFIAPDAKPDVRDRVVLIGYDADQFAPLETPSGKIRPHRAFAYALESIYSQFK